MSYLFDDASSNRITKASVMGMRSISLWFYPDDTTIDGTLYCECSANGTHYFRLVFFGNTIGDQVGLEITQSGSPPVAVYSGTAANVNAWNHVYAARGVVDTTKLYISLNGQTLQDAGSVGAVSGAYAATVIGCRGTLAGSRTEFYSGRIAEVGIWENCLNDFDDRYTALASAFDPRLIAVDPSGTAGLANLNLISYSPLIGNLFDLAVGNSWSTVSSPSVAEHCRVHRNFIE